MMAQPYGKTQIEIGYVISRTFATIGANFPVFLVLSVLFAGIPAVVVGYITQTILWPAVMSGDESTYIGTMYLVQIGSWLLLVIPTYVLIGALTHGSVIYLSGGKASLGNCLGTGFGRSLPLLALGLLSSLGVAFFLLLLIVPGIMAIVRWSVAAPALVVERIGIIESFKRSGELTRGSRWGIFGLIVVWAIASYIFELCITAAVSFGFTSMTLFDNAAIWIFAIITGVNSAVTNMIAAAGSAALYTELREIKDGATSTELAKVFD